MSSAPTHPDSFKCRKTLTVGAKTYEYFSLPDAEKNGLGWDRQPPVVPEGAAGKPAAIRG